MKCSLKTSPHGNHYNFYKDYSFEEPSYILTPSDVPNESSCLNLCDAFASCTGGFFDIGVCWLHYGNNDQRLQPMLKAKEDEFVFRKVKTLNPEVRYTLNVEEDVLLFRNPNKSSLSIL